MDQERELAWEWAGQFLSNSAWTRKNYFFSKLKNEAGVGRSLLFCGDTLHRFKCNYRYETFKIWLDTGTEELVIFYHLLFYLFMHWRTAETRFSLPACFPSLFYIFYWTLFALQCCVNFYCTAKWTSYTYTFFGLPTHLGPHRALNRTPCAIPVLCSLVIYFIHSINDVNMLIPISQFIPPIPQLSPLIAICFFPISVFLFLLCK